MARHATCLTLACVLAFFALRAVMPEPSNFVAPAGASTGLRSKTSVGAVQRDPEFDEQYGKAPEVAPIMPTSNALFNAFAILGGGLLVFVIYFTYSEKTAFSDVVLD
eukprot:TRINITY_DN761_c0_g1_i1.p1 TRINITY_DN761_c0_g1~~TRINITY_DN761_c0_g1_i1.p1  ORF type:complete len:107 (-),score=28.38 TRINITY_DN761_c0_g1_i1:134-454(-)